MSGFEIAGITLAGPAIVHQLIKVSIDGYQAFQDTKLVGKQYQQLKHDFDVQHERYLDWLRTLSASGGDLSNILDPKSRRYELVLTTLARIAGIFAEMDQLKQRYGITRITSGDSVENRISVAEEDTAAEKRGFKKYLGKMFSSRTRKQVSGSSPRPESTVAVLQSHGPLSEKSSSKGTYLVSEQELVTPGSGYGMKKLDSILKSPQDSELEVQVPGLERRVTELGRKAEEYQQALPMYRKYQWKYASKEQLEALVKDLAKYIDYLERLTSQLFIQRIAIDSRPFTFREFDVPTTLPFARLSSFCGREDIFARMENIFNPIGAGNLSSTRRVAVLHGMGGLGKSQIALEYAYRHTERYSAVFWVDATNWTTINNSGRRILESMVAHYATKYHTKQEDMFASIAIDLGIPGQINTAGELKGNAEKSSWQVVRDWMARNENTKWCLVADGLNEEEDARRLREVLPAGAHGHIIVTSRVTLPECEIIDIPVIDKDSGVKLLLGNKLGNVTQAVRETVEKIAEMLGNLPLALAQAVAYIQMRGLDFARYLERLTKDLYGLVDKATSGYGKGVFSCWKLSVEALKKDHPDSVPLLRICSFLSPDGVSEEMLTRGLGAMDWFQNDQTRLEDAIDDLVKYGLGKRISATGSQEIDTIWIHPLVQLWARNSILDKGAVNLESNRDDLNEMHRRGARDAILLVSRSLNAHFSDRKPYDWVYERRNIAHLKLCFDDYLPKYVSPYRNSADGKLGIAIESLAGYKRWWGEYQELFNLAQLSISFLEQAVVNDPSFEVQLLRSKQAEAEAYIFDYVPYSSVTDSLDDYMSKVVERQKVLLGEKHPDTLWSQSLMAHALHNVKKYDDALELYLSSLEIMENVLGEADPIYMVTLSNIALLYGDIGENEKALEIYARRYELTKHTGMLHYNSIIALENLSFFKSKLGDWEGARDGYEEAVAAAEATYGLANENTLGHLGALLQAYEALGQEDDAWLVREKIRRGESILRGLESDESC
ncbi:hypothetical protein ABW19_dt0210035 [Dactylella cylindrospora]|nr:hypothetical protein ABW19_dt0210035 [Dactylella cylindrospora]